MRQKQLTATVSFYSLLLDLSYCVSSLLEGDEQLDWPNSQTTLELSHADVA